MPIHEEIKEAVGNTNYKTLGEYSSLLYQEIMEDKRTMTKAMDEDFVRGRGRVNGGLDSAIVRAVKDLAEPDMAEAKAIVKQDSGIDPTSQGFHLAQTMTQLNQTLPNLMANLGALVPVLQQLVKGAQTTIPVTGQQNT